MLLFVLRVPCRPPATATAPQFGPFAQPIEIVLVSPGSITFAARRLDENAGMASTRASSVRPAVGLLVSKQRAWPSLRASGGRRAAWRLRG